MQRPTLRVLLVESRDEDARLVHRLLSAPGAASVFDLHRVAGVDDARRTMAQRQPDAILLGTPAGGASWLDFFIRMPADRRLPPVVVLTPEPDRASEGVAREAGAADCLGKSVLSTTILERSVAYAVQCRRTTEAMEETEVRFRSLTESMTDAALIVDEARRITYCNPAAERLFGFGAGELAGQPLATIVPAALLDGTGMDRIGAFRVSSGGPVVDGLRKDGTRVLIEVSPGEYTRNGARYVTAVVRDVTARSAAENALRASESRLRAYNRALVEISRQHAQSGAEGQLQRITRVAAHALAVDTVGVWLADAAGLTCADRYDRAADGHAAGPSCGPADYPAVFDALARVQASAPVGDADTTLSELMGSCPPLSGSGCMLAVPIWLNGRVAGVLCATAARADCEWQLEDRTFAASVADHVALALEAADRRAAEDAVRASGARLGQILNAIPAGVVVTDAAGAWLYENAAAARMLRGAAEAAPGHGEAAIPPALFLAGTDEPCPPGRMPLARALAGETAASDELEIQQPAGRVPLHVQAAPLAGPDGRVTGAVATFVDISERVKLEEQLRRAARMEAVGGLAGGIAHEFNNLLTAIRGNVELLLMDLAAQAPEREDLEEIRRAADRAETLTRQLLAFGRQQILRPRVLRLGDVVAGLRKNLARAVGPRIDVEVRAADDAGAVMADPGQVEQLLLHLAVNAREAMPGGGTLTVEVGNAALGPEDQARYPYISEPGEFVQLAVGDTGPGMDPAAQARVFEPFFSPHGPGTGTGLGLSTVYGIVKQSGGYVWVDSAPGEGCRFRVYLPRVHAGGEAGAPPAGPAAAEGRIDGTVLLVEDEPGVRRVAARALRAAGCTVLEADGVAQAVRLLREHGASIQLLLTDLVMPGGGGRRVVDFARRAGPGPRVLFMSGHTAEAVLSPQVEFDRAEFLQKPFTPAELCGKVREVLRAP